MNIAELLLNLNNKHGIHFQTSATGIPLEKGLEICNALEEYDPQNLYACEVYTDGSYSIYRKADIIKGETEDVLIIGVEP